MRRTGTRFACLLGAIWALGVFVAGCGDGHELPRTEQTVDGMMIYLGVVPAELVQGHSIRPGDPQAMHGGTQDQASHHVLAALFDAQSGARITDAQVQATVTGPDGTTEPARRLEPMEIRDTVTYGNFFLMQRSGMWRIHLEIHRSGLPKSTAADFAYERTPDS